MKDIMLDIETLSTDSNALVLSISAVIFDIESKEIGDCFEIGLNKEQQLKKGARVDAQTVKWWNEQSDEAKAMLERLTRVGIEEALNLFNDWITSNFKAVSKINLWGNGATFDNVIVENLYKRHDIEFAVPYYCHRDVRTLVRLAKINTRAYDFQGIKHNGIDDCLHQIKYCQDAYSKLNKTDEQSKIGEENEN